MLVLLLLFLTSVTGTELVILIVILMPEMRVRPQGGDKSVHRDYPVQRQRLWQQKPSYLTLTALEEASRIDSTAADSDKSSRFFNRGKFLTYSWCHGALDNLALCYINTSPNNRETLHRCVCVQNLKTRALCSFKKYDHLSLVLISSSGHVGIWQINLLSW